MSPEYRRSIHIDQMNVVKNQPQEAMLGEDDKEENNPNKQGGKSGGYRSYRGNHRSHVRGKGFEAVYRNNWMKPYSNSSTK